MASFYNVISYPFGMILGLFYRALNDNYALALILFTVFIKLILLPTSITQQKSAAKGTRTRAKVQKIQKKYANDREKLNKELQEFYAKEGYGSITGGCVPLLIQMPIIMGLYGAIYKPLSYILNIPKETVKIITQKGIDLGLYEAKNQSFLEFKALEYMDKIQKALPQVSDKVFDKINHFDFTIFGLQLGMSPGDDAATTAYYAVPAVAFVTAFLLSIYTYFRQKKTMPEMANNASMGCMMLFQPFISLWLSITFPVGIGIYWALNSILTLIQMLILNHTHSPEKVLARILVDETIVRRSKELNVKINKKAVDAN